MAYSAPTLAAMRPIISRSLRDPGGTVFGDEDINDFIKEGMADLSGYRPVEHVETYGWDGTLSQPPVGDLTYIWHVEIFVSGEPQYMIPANEQGHPFRNGWELFATSNLRLSAYWSALVGRLWDQGYAPDVVMWGYRDREMPAADADILDLQSSTDELALRLYGRAAGFQRLNQDRGLYQQWLAATNNTDVSPTQLQGMLGQADDAYLRNRRRATVIRRIPAGDFMYTD